MIKKLTILLLLSISIVLADPPNWQDSNPNQEYEFNASIAGAIVLSYGNSVAEEGDMFAAFDLVGNVRGVAVQVIPPFGPYDGEILYEMVLYSNTYEPMTFKYYDASQDEILDIVETIEFVIGGLWGNMIEPFIFNICACGECNCGDNICSVELWGECYNILETTELDLWNSGLTGEIPAEIGQLTNLNVLFLGNNQLSGAIPPEIGNLTNLVILDLSENQLIGEIPSEIENLTYLYFLYLAYNQLSGQIPATICNAAPVHFFNSNKLCPPYPDCGNGPITSEEEQDTSECYESTLGDVNEDGNLDVLDVVIVVDCALDAGQGFQCYEELGDVNSDGVNNILDIVTLVYWILNDIPIDIDGNVYEMIQIGDQVWMAENLKVTRYNNGDAIPYLSDENWGSFEEGQYGIYDHASSNADIYGNLYNGAVVNDERGVCPEGFHVPSIYDVITMITYLDENAYYYEEWDQNAGALIISEIAGGMMKSIGTIESGDGLWSSPNEGATNESGFTALPTGYRMGGGNFVFLGDYGYFLSTTEEDWCWILTKNSSVIGLHPNCHKSWGLPIRCLQD